MYKQLIQLNTRKTNNQIKKWEKALNRHFSKKTYRQLMKTWKDAQHCSLLERYKSTTMRYHLTPVRMALIKKSTSNKSWKGCRGKGMLLQCWWECKLIQPLQKTVWRFLKKLGIKPPYDTAIPLLGIYPEKPSFEKMHVPQCSLQHSTIART